MTVSQGHPANTSPGVPSQTFDILDQLISVRNVLSILQLDVDGEVMDAEKMQDEMLWRMKIYVNRSISSVRVLHTVRSS